MLDPEYKTKLHPHVIKACRLRFPFDDEATAVEKYCISDREFCTDIIESIKTCDERTVRQKKEEIQDFQGILDMVNSVLID